MKYYKDDCHHYKVLDNHRAVQVTNVGEFNTSICYDSYANADHYVIEHIKEKWVIPCTKKQYQTAFDKALKTINNLK